MPCSQRRVALLEKSRLIRSVIYTDPKRSVDAIRSGDDAKSTMLGRNRAFTGSIHAPLNDHF